MRIPLTKYGWPQVLLFPVILLASMAGYLLLGLVFLPGWAIVSGEVIMAVLLIWVLSFFRDPYRLCPLDNKILLAPADGKITDVEPVQHEDFIGGEALRIGIFMSIFNTHINRAPCNVKIEKIAYKKGRYKNAMNPESGRVNESNSLALVRTDEPKDKLLVRQISGAIARRIVCAAKEGQQLTSGEKFGMVKFGSRTELYLPARDDLKCLVRIGQKVKAGVTPVARYEKWQG